MKNGAENIRKSGNPGRTTGLISQPISNIRKQFAVWSIPQIPLRDLTASYGKSQNPKRCFLLMGVY